jgi:hypothetical protein
MLALLPQSVPEVPQSANPVPQMISLNRKDAKGTKGEMDQGNLSAMGSLMVAAAEK